jgi:hypothetical protein
VEDIVVLIWKDAISNDVQVVDNAAIDGAFVTMITALKSADQDRSHNGADQTTKS